MRVAKQSGRFELEHYTDGFPLWTEIYLDGGTVGKFAPEDLHDLKHCIDRMLALIDDTKGGVSWVQRSIASSTASTSRS